MSNPMPARYTYHTNCINSTYELISALTETASQITYRTFMKHVELDKVLALFPFYERDPRRGLTVKNDWAIGYYKGVYDGQPCYFMDHSRIEYIFLRQR